VILPVTRVPDKCRGNRYAVRLTVAHNMQDPRQDQQHEPSKSQRKRDLDELKLLGRELLSFSDDALRQLLLPETLLEALRTGQKIKAHGAQKRQLQYIGKLLREVDVSPIREAIEARDRQDATHTREFHRLEQLRDHLLIGDESALDEVMALFPLADRQHLRKLVRQARKEHQQKQPPRASRQLFRYLRELQESPDY
jgi:ribosome-associated protein